MCAWEAFSSRRLLHRDRHACPIFIGWGRCPGQTETLGQCGRSETARRGERASRCPSSSRRFIPSFSDPPALHPFSSLETGSWVSAASASPPVIPLPRPKLPSRHGWHKTMASRHWPLCAASSRTPPILSSAGRALLTRPSGETN
ncbi:hypothetical protein AAFF_G00073730 [Aldrovandia affinis]|uniref:Uncharacterized protein n=1 Tax=Aldrovandia affinis TaxID=143900 RepID=A0AAD7R1G3_9TELE|nr:hypothetical protein AAFF_G00073730 [Aldrovandia affinis]